MKPYRGQRAHREKVPDMVGAGCITRREACEGKIGYASRNEAFHAGKGVFQMTGRKVDVYRCPFCTQYHLTKLRHGEEEELAA